MKYNYAACINIMEHCINMMLYEAINYTEGDKNDAIYIHSLETVKNRWGLSVVSQIKDVIAFAYHESPTAIY